jgi:hypothetical protein
MQLEPIVQRLVEIQAQKGLNGVEFAQLLGVHAGHWSKVRRGLQKAGRDVIDGALRNFPELSFTYTDSLRKSSITPPETHEAVA